MFDFAKARMHMVESQIRTSDVTDRRLLMAFRTLPREAFAPKTAQALAYGDVHVPCGDTGRVMLRPREFAKMVHAADIQSTDVVLDIACGRGYSTAVLAAMADTVVGLDTTEEQVERTTALLSEVGVENAAIVKGDLRSGAPEHGPFDVIFVNGSVSEVPKTWTDQLTHGGRLVVVIDDGSIGRAHIFLRTSDVIGERVIFDASVPMLPGFEKENAFVF